ncbi:PAS domain S-box protein [Chitinimonas lacunae]|uniref:PAS domain S-box protein n=1 Tax=Chitinimonas lacunae TaxID=1963018 RepID=A0ABV8MRP7_9NEIS
MTRHVQRADSEPSVTALSQEPDPALDRLTRLAANTFDVPIVLLQSVPQEVCLSRVGPDDGVNWEALQNFCLEYVSAASRVVPNAQTDQRFASHPLVTGPAHLRFYACHPIRDGQGNIVAMLSLVDHRPRCLSREKYACLRDLCALIETQLRDRSAALSHAPVTLTSDQAFEQAAVGMAILSLDGRWLRVNVALCRLLGYSASELLQRDCQSLTHPEDRAADDVRLQSVLDGLSSSYSAEKRFFHQRGDVVWVQASMTLVRDADGQPDHLLAVIEDLQPRQEAAWIAKVAQAELEASIKANTLERRITTDVLGRQIDRRVEAQRELEAERNRIRTLLHHAYDAFIAMDQDGRIVEWNLAAETMFGIGRKEMIGRLLIDSIIPARMHGVFKTRLEHVVSTGDRSLFDRPFSITALRHGGEEFPAELTVCADRISDRLLFSAFLRDLSEVELQGIRDYRDVSRDRLTSLPNRSLFVDYLTQALDRSVRQRRHVAVLSIDIDRFHLINEEFGRPVGDVVLHQYAERLRSAVRRTDTVCRLGGDRFAVLLEGLGSDPQADAGRVGEKVFEELSRPILADGHRIELSSSIGIAVHRCDGIGGVDVLLERADAEMYRAKHTRWQRYVARRAG